MNNFVKYKIKNLNQIKILNELSNKSEIVDVKIDSQFISFKINKKYEKKADKYFIFRNVEVLEKKEIGIAHNIKKVVFNIGLISAIVLFSAFLAISNIFVYNVDIIGTKEIDENKVYEILQQNGIKNIVKKSSINTKKIENSLQQIEQISLVSAIIKGNTLIINIKEKVNNPEYTEKDNFKPIVAKYDAKITDINLLQGTLVVKQGDFVKKGDVLVEAYTINSNGEKCGILAMADIKGDVFYSKSNTYYDSKLELCDTGNYVTYKTLTFLNGTIYNNFNGIPYKKYRTEIEEKYISENQPLPIKQTITKYYEQTEKIVESNFEDNKHQYAESVKSELISMLEEFDIIKQEYSYVERSAGINVLTYTIVVSKSIA